MKFNTFIKVFLAAQGILSQTLQAVPQRPSFSSFPKHLGRSWWEDSPPRDPRKLCIVPHGEIDDAPGILKSIKACNNGGTVVFLPSVTYIVASPLDLTFLKNIDIAILGKIVLKDDVEYWQTHFFAYSFQGAVTFWRFGGEDVNIFGLGVGEIDGQGQTWWTAQGLNSTTLRPVLFTTDGLKRSTISGLTMTNSPNWFNLISNSTDVLITDHVLNVKVSNASHPAKNTDGWDTYRSSNVIIQDSSVDNTDDCVSFKPNSTQILVQNLWCNGSHGISVGSLGQYRGVYDIVEDVYVYNISMNNAGDGARIKVWPGLLPDAPANASGGGSGHVRNVTYEKFGVQNVDSSITLTQCYYAANQSACDQYPASLVIEDVNFKTFFGVTSKKYDPKVGSLICSSPSVCKNIQAHDIKVTPPSGGNATWTCTNMDNSQLDINCV